MDEEALLCRAFAWAEAASVPEEEATPPSAGLLRVGWIAVGEFTKSAILSESEEPGSPSAGAVLGDKVQGAGLLVVIGPAVQKSTSYGRLGLGSAL